MSRCKYFHRAAFPLPMIMIRATRYARPPDRYRDIRSSLGPWHRSPCRNSVRRISQARFISCASRPIHNSRVDDNLRSVYRSSAVRRSSPCGLKAPIFNMFITPSTEKYTVSPSDRYSCKGCHISGHSCHASGVLYSRLFLSLVILDVVAQHRFAAQAPRFAAIPSHCAARRRHTMDRLSCPLRRSAA